MAVDFHVVFVFSCVLFVPVFNKPSIGDVREYDFPFYPRSFWRAEPPIDVQPLITPVPYVTIHHTYIPEACNTTAACSEAMRGMQRYHKYDNDWGDIGYNFCIGSEGGAYEGRGWTVKGIHTGNANGVSIGICLIGDWRFVLPPPQQLETTKALIRAGVKKGFIQENYKLVGHRQIMSTECPGDALFSEIQGWEHFVEISPDDPLTTQRKKSL